MNRGLYVPINTTGNVGTTELEARLALSALFEHNAAGVPRSGLLIPAGSSQTTIVTGAANMSYNLAACHPVINTAANDGVYSFTATGTTNVVTTAAPATNSRIDLIWVKQNDKSKGDADNLAVFGVTQGVAASSPVAPALPARALEVARATILSTTTATNTAVITQTFKYAALKGTPIPVRDTTDRATITAPTLNQRVRRLDKSWPYVQTFDGTNWIAGDAWEANTTANGLSGGTVYNMGVLSVQGSPNTTDTSFITTGTSSSLVFRDPGDYLVTVTGKLSVASTGRAFVSLETADTGGSTLARGAIPNGEDTGTAVALVTATAGMSVFPKVFHSNSGAPNFTGKIRAKRILH